MRHASAILLVATLAACTSGTSDKDDTDTRDSDDTDASTETDAVDTDDTEDSDNAGDSDVDTDVDSDVETDLATPWSDEDPCFVEQPTMELGTGEEAFISLAPMDEVEMVAGPQGGWHITTSLLLDNMLQIVTFDFTVTDVASGQLLHDEEVTAFLTSTSDTWMCEGSYLNYQAVLPQSVTVDMNTGTPPEVLCGREVRIDVDVRALDSFSGSLAGQVLASDSVVVVTERDSDDGPACNP